MTSVDNQQPSLLTEEGSETKDYRSDSIIECPTTKKRIPWNKGLTKETHHSLKRVSEKVSGEGNGSYGKKAWNKGLTKEMDNRVLQNGISRSESYKKGDWKAWNKGLTKETHVGIASQAVKMKGILVGDKHPAKRPEVRKRISEAATKRIREGKWYPRSKHGVRKDLGHYVRSSWEANFSRVLRYLDVNYEFEQYSFPIGISRNYLPDFYLTELKCFVEIKGFKGWGKGQAILFREYYDIPLVVIDEESYKIMRSKFKPLIPEWEDDLW